MGFLGRWMADCVRLLCMLGGALVFMQIPAVTHIYVVGLLQVAQDARRDIDRRLANARDYYHLPADAREPDVIAALRASEPSNAETLRQSIARAAMFDDTRSRIMVAPPLSQPLRAALDAFRRPDPDKLAVLRTSITTYAPQIALEASAVLYGIVGLLLGGLIGHSIAPPGMASRRLRGVG